MKRHIYVVFTALLCVLAACSGTRQAYQAAEGLEETAKVIAEHYYATVREANRLVGTGELNGGQRRIAQDIVRTTRPLIVEMAEAAQAYTQLKNADTEAQLEAAITRAALAVSDLIDVIKDFRSGVYDPLSDSNVLFAGA